METPLEDNKCTSDPAGSSYTMKASSYLEQRIIRSGMVDIIEGEVEFDDSLSAPLNAQSVSIPARSAKMSIISIDEEEMRVAREIRDVLRKGPFKCSVTKTNAHALFSCDPLQPSKGKTQAGTKGVALTVIEEEGRGKIGTTDMSTASADSTVSWQEYGTKQKDAGEGHLQLGGIKLTRFSFRRFASR